MEKVRSDEDVSKLSSAYRLKKSGLANATPENNATTTKMVIASAPPKATTLTPAHSTKENEQSTSPLDDVISQPV